MMLSYVDYRIYDEVILYTIVFFQILIAVEYSNIYWRERVEFRKKKGEDFSAINFFPHYQREIQNS